IADLDDHIPAQFPLRAKIECHDAGDRGIERNRAQIAREATRGAAARVIYIAVEQIGAVAERRVARSYAQKVCADAVIKDAEAATDGRLTVAEQVVSETQTRAETAVIRLYAAARQPDEQALQFGVAGFRNAPSRRVRKTCAEDDDAVVRVG